MTLLAIEDLSVSFAGVRYGALPEAVAEAGRPPLPSDAWLLIDGEAPAGTRWALAESSSRR